MTFVVTCVCAAFYKVPFKRGKLLLLIMKIFYICWGISVPL